MESFYGGRPGVPFVIKKTFDGIDIPEPDKVGKTVAIYTDPETTITYVICTEETGLGVDTKVYYPIELNKENQNKYIWKFINYYNFVEDREYPIVIEDKENPGQFNVVSGKTFLKDTGYYRDAVLGMYQYFNGLTKGEADGTGKANLNEVGYGEYVLIDTVKNLHHNDDIDNGKIFRRGFEGPEYIGQIRGAPGDMPFLNFVRESAVHERGAEEGIAYEQIHLSVPDLGDYDGLIPGTVHKKDADGNLIYEDGRTVKDITTQVDSEGNKIPGFDGYNDEVTYSWIHHYNAATQDVVGYDVGFTLPYLVQDFYAKPRRYKNTEETGNILLDASKLDPYDNPVVTRVDDYKHPFYQEWLLDVPPGVKGDSVTRIQYYPEEGAIKHYVTNYDDAWGIYNEETGLWDQYPDSDEHVTETTLVDDIRDIKGIKLHDDGQLEIIYKRMNGNKNFSEFVNSNEDETLIKWITGTLLNTTTGEFNVLYNADQNADGNKDIDTYWLKWVKEITFDLDHSQFTVYTVGQVIPDSVKSETEGIWQYTFNIGQIKNIAYNFNTGHIDIQAYHDILNGGSLVEGTTYTVSYPLGHIETVVLNRQTGEMVMTSNHIKIFKDTTQSDAELAETLKINFGWLDTVNIDEENSQLTIYTIGDILEGEDIEKPDHRYAKTFDIGHIKSIELDKDTGILTLVTFHDIIEGGSAVNGTKTQYTKTWQFRVTNRLVLGRDLIAEGISKDVQGNDILEYDLLVKYSDVDGYTKLGFVRGEPGGVRFLGHLDSKDELLTMERPSSTLDYDYAGFVYSITNEVGVLEYWGWDYEAESKGEAPSAETGYWVRVGSEFGPDQAVQIGESATGKLNSTLGILFKTINNVVFKLKKASVEYNLGVYSNNVIVDTNSNETLETRLQTLNNNIATINNNIANLTSTVERNKAELEKSISDNVATLTQSIETNRTEVDKVISDLDVELTKTIETNKTEVNKSISDNVSTLNQTIATNRSEIDKSIADNVTTLNQAIQDNRTSISNLSNTVASNKTDADTKIDSVSKSLTDNVAALTKTDEDFNTRITNLESTSATKDSVNALTEQINGFTTSITTNSITIGSTTLTEEELIALKALLTQV